MILAGGKMQKIWRFYFKDEMVDQLNLSDRIFQNILLKQLKPTQFFSGIYLKPFDDAFDNMNVSYLRYRAD
jgi:hypothetical protein